MRAPPYGPRPGAEAASVAKRQRAKTPAQERGRRRSQRSLQPTPREQRNLDIGGRPYGGASTAVAPSSVTKPADHRREQLERGGPPADARRRPAHDAPRGHWHQRIAI